MGERQTPETKIDRERKRDRVDERQRQIDARDEEELRTETK